MSAAAAAADGPADGPALAFFGASAFEDFQLVAGLAAAGHRVAFSERLAYFVRPGGAEGGRRSAPTPMLAQLEAEARAGRWEVCGCW